MSRLLRRQIKERQLGNWGSLSLRRISVSMSEWTNDGLRKALRHYLNESRLSEYRVAQMMGVSVSSLNDWLNGWTQPRQQTLNAISEFLQRHPAASFMEKKLPPVERS
jgi:hypothetical protein